MSGYEVQTKLPTGFIKKSKAGLIKAIQMAARNAGVSVRREAGLGPRGPYRDG